MPMVTGGRCSRVNEFHHYLLKAWYDGRSYHGSQYQPGLRTVDGALVDALKAQSYIPAGEPHNDYFKISGRTDKGVSARGAVYYVNANRQVHPDRLNDWFKRHGHDIAVWALARLQGEMNPRKASARVYKHVLVLPGHPLDAANVREGLNALTGYHDFTGFAKGQIATGTRTERTIDEARLDVDGDVHVFTFRSQGFLWGQVRKMVAFIVKYHDNPSLPSLIDAVYASKQQPNMEPADPHGLILWEVVHDNVTWEHVDGTDAYIQDVFKAYYAKEKAMATIATMLHDACKKDVGKGI